MPAVGHGCMTALCVTTGGYVLFIPEFCDRGGICCHAVADQVLMGGCSQPRAAVSTAG